MNLGAVIRDDPEVQRAINRKLTQMTRRLECERLVIPEFARTAARLTARMENDLHPENVWRRPRG